MSEQPPAQAAELWPADVCAAERGVPVEEWRWAVLAGREPLPVVDDGPVRLWDSHAVRTWRHHGQVREGEWLAPRCAAHHGVTVQEWRKLVRNGEAPAPRRKVGRYQVWDMQEVQQLRLEPELEQPIDLSRRSTPASDVPVTRPPRPVRPREGPDPNRPWDTADCADYLGIAPRAWRAMVRAGQTPPATGIEGVRKPTWSPQDVMSMDLDSSTESEETTERS